MTDTSKPGESHVDDETKQRFREALDRKHAHGGVDVSDHSARSKVKRAHGPENAETSQTFRRKSAP